MDVTELSPEVRYALIVNRRLMRLPYGGVCADCGTDRLIALIPPRQSADGTPRGPILCLGCLEVLEGKNPVQEHDLGGRPSPLPKVPVPRNFHEQLIQLQNCFWRGRHEPGSPYAVGFDMGAWLALKHQWDSDDEPS